MGLRGEAAHMTSQELFGSAGTPRISTPNKRSFSIHAQTCWRVTPISAAIFGPGITTMAFFTRR